MSDLSKTRKGISGVLKLIVIVSAAVGTFLSAYAGRNSFMGGSRVFMYFTIQSNILIALICAAGAFFLIRKKAVGKSWYIVKLTGTVSITLTGVVFAVMLAPILGDAAWNVQNTLTHLIVPLAAVDDFFFEASGSGLERKDAFWVIVPPLMYVIYAGIGYANGWEFAKGQNYPYFFLNWGSPAGAFGFTDKLPYLGCVWWILILLAFLIAVAWGYTAAAGRIGKCLKSRREERNF